MPKPGERAAYRPMPVDFAEVFVRMGFNGCCTHFRAHWRNVARWIDINGGDTLRAERMAWLKANGQRRRVNYVMGRRLSSPRLMAVDIRSDRGEQ